MAKDPLYPFQIEQHTEGWAQAGFDRKTVEVRVRNAPNHSPPNVQFEVYADEVKGQRTFTHSASFTLTPAEAVALAQVISPEAAAAADLLAACKAVADDTTHPILGSLQAQLRAAIAKAGG